MLKFFNNTEDINNKFLTDVIIFAFKSYLFFTPIGLFFMAFGLMFEAEWAMNLATGMNRLDRIKKHIRIKVWKLQVNNE